MLDRVGLQLGNYRLLRLLGQGGFADVYLGEHIFLKTKVAIKVLQAQMKQREVQDFLKEAQTVALLKHPSIVRILDFGVNEATPFLVMDFAPLGTLRDRHPRGTRIALPTIVSYVKQMASALQYAHHQKMVHRDVKPENMLVESNDSVLLSDFGIAVAAHKTQSLSTQEAIGTVMYMAPEQIKGKARPASDQYSLAIVVYEWLCGACPFTGSTSIEIAMSHISDPPPPLRAKGATISSEVEHVVLKALAKDPSQRYENILAFAQALEQASEASPRTSSPDTNDQGAQHSTSKVSRRTAIAIGASAGVVLFGGAVIWLTTSYQGQRSATPPNRSSSIGTLFFTYTGHRAAVTSASWSPDGKHIASGSYDNTMQIWNVDGSGQPFIYRGHNAVVISTAWSPDGKRIVSGAFDGTVQIWNVDRSGQPFIHIGRDGFTGAAAWSPNGKQIVSEDGYTVQIWNVDGSGQPFIYKGHSANVRSVAWSPDGKQIVSAGGNDKTVQIWNVDGSGQPFIYRGHSDHVSSAAWSPNGKQIASGSWDKTVQVWNADGSGQPFIYRGHSDSVGSVAWSPDGTRIASGGENGIYIWNVDGSGQTFIYKDQAMATNIATWSPNGKLIASSTNNIVQIWGAI